MLRTGKKWNDDVNTIDANKDSRRYALEANDEHLSAEMYKPKFYSISKRAGNCIYK